MKPYSLDEIRSVPLKNRWLAAFLAWLCPGLGHFYQGRTAKGGLFFCTIVPLLVAGLWMGSYRESVGSAPDGAGAGRLCFAKNAYFQWQPGNKRLYFFPQALNAAVAVPAVIQAKIVQNGAPPLFHGAFAPPAVMSYSSVDRISSSRPTLNALLLRLHSWFEMGTIFLASAGLLNLLVIFDALCGPSWIIPDEIKELVTSEALKEEKK
ncbi:MAG: DUF6677 family protein [Thermoguttaceae bacterium]|jgi:hypothetical protein